MREGEISGAWEGSVVDNKDPLGLRRLKIRVHNEHGTALELPDAKLPWSLPCFPYPGDDFTVPKGTPVWVIPRHGDPQSFVWIGFWYPTGKGPKDLAATGPPKAEPKGNYRELPSGWHIGFNEKDPENKFEVRAPADEYVFKMDLRTKEISLVSQAGLGIKINLATGILDLGLNAQEAAVLGTAFSSLFNLHPHPVTMSGAGPTTMPMLPGTHTSRIVKVK